MAQAMELRPPTEPGEIETLTFDFAPLMSTGETITAVYSFLCAVIAGSDVATGHLVGQPAIINSPSSGFASQAVMQQVGSMKGGTTYQYQCMVSTSADQRLQLRANLPCVIVPQGSSNS